MKTSSRSSRRNADPRRETATPAPPPTAREGYLHWSRDPAVSVLTVVPLWLAYEVLRFTLAPHERNGAEALVTESLRLLGPRALLVLDALLGLAFLASAVSVLRRRVPWGHVAVVSAVEGATYGLVLGPMTQVLTLFLLDHGVAMAIVPPVRAVDLIGSLGAGVFEEAVFRLALLAPLALLLSRGCRQLGLPRLLGVVVAVVLSALAFSAFHHVGAGGEPYRPQVFWFRTVAGVVLGTVFVLRGFGVVVYTHAVYDVHYYLTHDVP